jgi:hypothetical protein
MCKLNSFSLIEKAEMNPKLLEEMKGFRLSKVWAKTSICLSNCYMEDSGLIVFHGCRWLLSSSHWLVFTTFSSHVLGVNLVISTWSYTSLVNLIQETHDSTYKALMWNRLLPGLQSSWSSWIWSNIKQNLRFQRCMLEIFKASHHTRHSSRFYVSLLCVYAFPP